MNEFIPDIRDDIVPFLIDTKPNAPLVAAALGGDRRQARQQLP
jgi:hypothetical protein